MSGYRTFVVPYDFSENARAALRTAVELAEQLGADLQLVHVVQPPAYGYGYGGMAGAVTPPPVDMQEIAAGARHSLEEVAREVNGFSGRIEAHVFEGASVADAIQESAEKLGADLIVMGTHGRTGLAKVALGSVAERTLRGAPCPVLTVPDGEAEGGPEAA